MLAACVLVALSGPVQKPRKLNDRHWIFVQEFAKTGDRRTAADRAGFQGDDLAMSVTASKLLARTDVQEALVGYRAYLENPSKNSGQIVEDANSLLTREGRRIFLARLANGDGQGGMEAPPWSVRVTAVKLLGEMDGDYIPKRMPANPEEGPKTVYNLIITPDDAKDVLQGNKQLEEVIDVRGTGSGDSGDGGGPGGAPDAVDLLVHGDLSSDEGGGDGS